MCAAAECAVGCDVQEKSRNVDSVLRCLTPSEREMVRKDSENFYRIWTLKESYIKMTGEGLSRPLQSFEAMLEPEAGIAAEGFHGTVREYAGPPPCRYACCIERGSLPEEMARIRLEDTLW
jgi:4'-phosphopantetheinyl transferase